MLKSEVRQEYVGIYLWADGVGLDFDLLFSGLCHLTVPSSVATNHFSHELQRAIIFPAGLTFVRTVLAAVLPAPSHRDKFQAVQGVVVYNLYL